MMPVLAIGLIGLAFILVGMVYGRVVDKVECLFCEAIVPRFYASPDAEGKNFICAVCQRARFEYPFGSARLPKKMACSNCKRQFYPLPHLFLARDGNGPSVCRYCIVADIGIKKAISEVADDDAPVSSR